MATAPAPASTDLEAAESPDHQPPPPPPSRWHQDDLSAAMHRVRLMCSFGGRIVPRPHDNQLRYIGGDTRIVAVSRQSTTFSSLISKLSKLSGAAAADIAVKYQLPNEDLDALVSVTSDEDLDNMMEEYDRLLSLSSPSKPPRLRLFLFNSSSGGGFGSPLLDGKPDHWFVDVLNGGGGGSAAAMPSALERGRSEVSSILSEVPDYLFGLDASSDDTKLKTDPSSPSAAVVAVELPPVKTKTAEIPTAEPAIHNPTGFVANHPVFYVQEPVPVYYVPGSLPMRQLPVTVPVQYSNPVHHHHHAPVYVGAAPVTRAAGYEYPVADGFAAGVVPAYSSAAAAVAALPPTPIPTEVPGIATAGQELRLGGRASPQQ